ncbi:MAG: GDSL-type esterase/lipase family protein [Patescibacteria group bacterium]
MKKVITVILIIAVLLVGGWFVFFRTETQLAASIRNYPSSGENIIAFGDSLVFGVGSENGGFVQKLSDQIGQPIINEGVPGNTTEQALKRINSVLEQDPKIVIVLLGGNDALQKVPVSETFKKLDEIITKIEERGAIVVLLGVQGGILSDPYSDQFKELAKKHDSAFIPHILAGVFGNKEFMYDTVHPNDAGYQKIADKIKPLLQSLVKI